MSRLEARLTLLDRVLRRPVVTPLDGAVADRVERSLRSLEPDGLYRRRLRGAVVSRYVATREGLVPPPGQHREMGALGRGVLYAALAVALSVGAAGTVAAGSLPGDLLYPMKLEIEEVRLRIAPPAMRADLLATTLDERLDELEQLAAAGKWDAVAVAARAAAAARQRLTGAGNAAGQSAVDALGDHAAVLEALVTSAPASAQEGLKEAIRAASSQQGLSPGAQSARPASTGQGQQPPRKAPKPES